MGFTVVSFYTEQTPYEREVANLIASLDKLGIRYRVRGVKSQGSWEKNCQYKAEYIMDALTSMDTDIVWVDADAVVVKYPLLFDDLACDIAYHYLENRRELLSGTLFFRNNDNARSLVDKWIKVNRTNSRWDQKNLQEVVEADAEIRKLILPAEYCKIYDNKLQAVTDPVITHYQASRRFKKLIQQPAIGRKR